MSVNQAKENDVVLTGIGILTSAGHGSEETIETFKSGAPVPNHNFTLNGFKPAPFMSDKRMLKAVSAVDAYGIVAIENLKKDSGFEIGQYRDQRVGIYVGAGQANVNDNSNYYEAMRQAVGADGVMHEAEFGKTFNKARPTTLLLGLTNNVLCYGSILLDAKGPNSNYMTLETSSHLAFMQAAKYVGRGKLDYAIAGGYAAYNDPADVNSYKLRGLVTSDDNIHPYSDKATGSIFGDGAAFVSLERRSDAERHNRKVIAAFVAGAHTSDAKGPATIAATDSESLQHCIKKTLKIAGLEANQVGMVFGSGSALPTVDSLETTAVDSVFGNSVTMATTTRVWGNLMEAGGIGEVAIAKWLYDENDLVPEHLAVAAFEKKVQKDKPYVLILRVAPHGEYSCILLRVEV